MASEIREEENIKIKLIKQVVDSLEEYGKLLSEQLKVPDVNPDIKIYEWKAIRDQKSESASNVNIKFNESRKKPTGKTKAGIKKTKNGNSKSQP